MDNWEEVLVRQCQHGTIVTGPWMSAMWWHPGSKTWCDDMAPTAILSQPAVSERRKPRSVETMLRENAAINSKIARTCTEVIQISEDVQLPCACNRAHAGTHEVEYQGVIYKW